MATKTLHSPMSNHLTGHGGTVKGIETDLSRVPVVTHIITDEDIGILQGAKVQAVNLNKVIKLLTDPHSAMLYDRHLHALNKVVRHYPGGFLMKDLVAIFKILNVCADRVGDNPVYIEPMLDLLKLCRFPFLKEKSSDEMSFEQIAAESVSQLGYLMRVPNKDIRHEICGTLTEFYCEAPSKQKLQGLKPNSLTYNQNIVEQSDVAETLVKSLALVENDLDVKLVVLSVLQKLSKHSAHNCNLMLRANGANRICSRLMDYDPSGQLLFTSCDILWNLLEYGDYTGVAQQLNNLTCIGQLRDAFIYQLTQGYSHYDRQLRNDLLIISSLVAKTCSDAPFIETGFVKQLVLLATFQEVKSHHAMVKHLKLGQNYEDFEIKKLLVTILINLSVDSSVIPLLSEGRLLLALFSYVKSNEKTTGPREWTVAQMEELQLHAMNALATLGPILIDDYMTCQGGTRLLLLLEWCTGSDDFKGQGNSFFGRGGRGNKRAQMRHCLRLMRSMVSTGESLVLQDFVDQGAVHQLTGILGIMCKTSQAKQDEIDIEMQCDMLFLLSALCDGDMHRKELFGSQGVEVVVSYLKIDPQLLTSGLGHHRLMLTAVDCIWCAVVGCYVTEDDFLEKEGVFLLIDILEKCPKNMHNLVLGCLLDLSENAKTVPHINAWRGSDDISAAHLLCDIWRNEELDMKVNRDNSGAISDVKKPLMGDLQEKQGVISLPANAPSQSIVDVSENMRAKIYALFCKLGFIELPGLTTEDHVTLTLIEHYLDFKLGEVWSEVITELEQDNIRPTTPDKEALEAISRTVDERAEHVLEVQRELLDAQLQQDLIDEQEFYAEIRENHRQKEKAIHDFHDYIARTSNYTLLMAAKQRQETSIDASRVQTNYKTSETFHSTEIPNLQATTFSGRNVTIESTPLELTGGMLSDYDPTTGTLRRTALHGDPDKDSDESQFLADETGSGEHIINPETQMEEALKALDVLSKSDITELKALAAPPKLVKDVMDAVCVLLKQKPSWNSAKMLLADPSFIGKLIEFVPDSITDAQLKKLTPYINNPEFVPERLASVSKSAVGLCKWVRALYVYAKASRDLQRTKAEEMKRHQKQLLLGMKEDRRDNMKELVD